VADRHVRTLARERDGGSAADPRVAAGDESTKTLESSGTAVALLTVVGLRAHLAGQAGGLLLLRGETAGVVGHCSGIPCDIARGAHIPTVGEGLAWPHRLASAVVDVADLTTTTPSPCVPRGFGQLWPGPPLSPGAAR